MNKTPENGITNVLKEILDTSPKKKSNSKSFVFKQSQHKNVVITPQNTFRKINYEDLLEEAMKILNENKYNLDNKKQVSMIQPKTKQELFQIEADKRQYREYDCVIKQILIVFKQPKLIIYMFKDQQLSVLDIDKNITNVDASKNKIQSLQQEPIRQNTEIKQLNVSFNIINQMNDVELLINLVVLNLSNNKIVIMCGLDKLTKLAALILNNNLIKKIQGLTNCVQLNTLVLSHNQIQIIQNIDNLKKLKKLSISHNQIISMDGITKNLELEEVRINDNLIQIIPDSIRVLSKLRILDIGKNKIDDLDSIEYLKDLKLINLNVKGNPCSLEAVKLALQFPRIRFINGQPSETALKQEKLKIQEKIDLKKIEKSQRKQDKLENNEPDEEIPVPKKRKDENIVLNIYEEPKIVQSKKKSNVVKVDKIQRKFKHPKLNLQDNMRIEKW
ncbi:hypothetical protein pb186bvf_017151 [Paramecium bursaria]